MREYAYAPRDERVHATRSGRNRKATNVIGALCDGVHLGVERYEHATTASFFEEWFSRLLPKLPRGCTVVMDNASFHRKARLEEASRKARRKIALLFLPPYSADLNPIEKSWANLKKFLRNRGRDFDSVHLAIEAFFKLA